MSDSAPANFLSMSDDEVLNMVGPPEVAEPIGSSEAVEPEPVVEKLAVVAENAGDADESDGKGAGADPEPGEGGAADGDIGAVDANPVDKDADENIGNEPPVVEPVDKTKDPEPGTKAGDAAEAKAEVVEPKTEVTEKAPPTPEEYEGFYKQIMAPFKANGKTIELRTPEEAIQLMQMGANYTRKLQDIQPHRKTLLMLENNGLLGDEDKLSFLIDLEKKDPEAIKKLIKDAGIDPLDIDTSVEPAYLEGNHTVTDEEANFQQAITDLTSLPAGKETVQLINSKWDETSKDALWKSPEIMTIIHEQRESGVYDLITTEMDRQMTLGKIPTKTPFLEAYKIVGDELAKANTFGDLSLSEPVTGNPPGNPVGKPEPVVVETRAAAPKSQVANEDKASAASTTRSTPKATKTLVNPLGMADDEFLKQMNQRL